MQMFFLAFPSEDAFRTAFVNAGYMVKEQIEYVTPGGIIATTDAWVPTGVVDYAEVAIDQQGRYLVNVLADRIDDTMPVMPRPQFPKLVFAGHEN